MNRKKVPPFGAAHGFRRWLINQPAQHDHAQQQPDQGGEDRPAHQRPEPLPEQPEPDHQHHQADEGGGDAKSPGEAVQEAAGGVADIGEEAGQQVDHEADDLAQRLADPGKELFHVPGTRYSIRSMTVPTISSMVTRPSRRLSSSTSTRLTMLSVISRATWRTSRDSPTPMAGLAQTS